jgi:hypothetical protein
MPTPDARNHASPDTGDHSSAPDHASAVTAAIGEPTGNTRSDTPDLPAGVSVDSSGAVCCQLRDTATLRAQLRDPDAVRRELWRPDAVCPQLSSLRAQLRDPDTVRRELRRPDTVCPQLRRLDVPRRVHIGWQPRGNHWLRFTDERWIVGESRHPRWHWRRLGAGRDRRRYHDPSTPGG